MRTGDVFGLDTQELSLTGEELSAGVSQDRVAGAAGPAGRAIRSATCRCAASGCSKTRCAPSACASTDPATARGGCTGRPRRARQGRPAGQGASSRRPVIACTSCSTSARRRRTGRGRATTREALEAAITTAASVANWASERGFLVGLAANAKLFHSSAAVRIAPSRDPQQLMHIFEALATAGADGQHAHRDRWSSSRAATWRMARPWSWSARSRAKR